MNIGLEKRAYWDVNQLVDADELFPGKAKMIQAIKDLAPIIEGSIPEDELKKLKYSKNLSAFFPRFLKLFEKLRTPFRGYEINYDGKYYINANCFYDYSNHTFYSMPLSFLPLLRIKNKKLHDMIIEAVRILSDKCVSVIDDPYIGDDDYLIEGMLEYCSVTNGDNPDDDQILAKRELELFFKYKKKYLDKIMNKSGDRLWLIGQVSKYKPTMKVENMIIDWLNEVMDAANEPNDLEQFNENAKCDYARENDIDYEDIYNDGNPVEITQVMRFSWFGNNGYMKAQCEQLGEYAGNFGVIEFSHSYECRKPGELEESRQKFFTDWGMFPEKLTYVMAHGNELADEIWGYIDNNLTAILDDGKR